jgi:hypothetical protein
MIELAYRGAAQEIKEGPVPQPGKGATAPAAKGPEAKAGEIRPFNDRPAASYWLHPAAVRAVIAFCDDAYLAGHTKDAFLDDKKSVRDLLGIYLGALKVAADTPVYKEAIKEVEKLNEQKREFNETLVATVQAVDTATTTILNNQLAILELQGQRDAKLDQLSLEALRSVQDMGRRARERLLLYQYYLLKSYHYLMLKDLPRLTWGRKNSSTNSLTC